MTFELPSDDQWTDFLNSEADKLNEAVETNGTLADQIGGGFMGDLLVGVARKHAQCLSAAKTTLAMLFAAGKDTSQAEADVKLFEAELRMLGGDPDTVEADTLHAWTKDYGYQYVPFDQAEWNPDTNRFVVKEV